MPPIIYTLLALTDAQVDTVLKMIEHGLQAIQEGVKAVWILLSSALLAYLAYRQAVNRKALDQNTEVSKEAFKVANSHNEKISKLSEQVVEVASKAIPQQVEVVNTQDHPVPVENQQE